MKGRRHDGSVPDSLICRDSQCEADYGGGSDPIPFENGKLCTQDQRGILRTRHGEFHADWLSKHTWANETTTLVKGEIGDGEDVLGGVHARIA
jgi:hypothetical protein